MKLHKRRYTLRKISTTQPVSQNNNTHPPVSFSAARHLYKNTKVTRTHSRLSYLFDRFVLNRLTTWFSKNGKVTEFVRKERQQRGLDEADIVIESKVYGIDKHNSTLLLQIIKNGIDFIHLSIHLAPKYINDDHSSSGFVHIVKDIYMNYGIKPYKECLIKTLYAIFQPENKPHSLSFIPYLRKCTYAQLPEISVNPSHDKMNLSKAIDMYEHEVQQEIDVITSVLNKMFDENDSEHYVGNRANDDIHPNTNALLHNINQRPNFIRRKNRGVYFSNHGGSHRFTRKK